MKKSLLTAVVLSCCMSAALFVLGCAKSASKAKLVYWSMWNEAEPQGMVIAQAAQAFTKATGITVDVNFNGREIRKTLQPALDAGETIDLFDEDIERVLNAWGNYVLPLDEYVQKPIPPPTENRTTA